MPTRLATALGLILALVLYNAAFTFHNRWPTPWPELRGELSWELAVLLAVLALLAEAHNPLRRTLARVLVTALVVLAALGRYAEVTAPALFGRRINLYWDVRYLPDVTRMLADVMPLELVALAILLGLAAAVTAVAVLHACSGMLRRALDDHLLRRCVLVLALVMLAVHQVRPAQPWLGNFVRFSLPITGTYAEQVGFILQARRLGDGGQFADTGLPVAHMATAARPDIFVFFLESYGQLVFDDAHRREALAPAMDRLHGVLRGGGWSVVSARIDAPTFGGYSWLSHASFLAGLDIRDNGTYQLLLTSGRPTLVSRLKEAGYRTVALMPGVRRAWPEGGYYGFDALYSQRELKYDGPAFGWWALPDQFSLERVHKMEVAPRPRPPVLLVFTTISSHMPFAPVPPYLVRWDRVLAPGAYENPEVHATIARGARPEEVHEAFLDSMDYNMRWVAGYLEQRAPADSLFIVVGDHQPPAVVSGPGRNWEVPMHVISREPRLVEPFADLGFVAGTDPRGAAVLPMHELAAPLIRVLSGTGG